MATAAKNRLTAIADPTAEAWVIGSLLIDPTLADDQVRPEHFADAQHRAAFVAITALKSAGQPVDAVLVARALWDSPAFTDKEVAPYLAAILEEVPTSAHYGLHVADVREAATKREIYNAARQALEQSQNGHASAAILAEWRGAMEALESATPTAPTFRRITCLELATGEFRLEYLIAGALVKGQPLIIAGCYKTLKTSIIIDAAVALATGGCWLGRFRVNEPQRVLVMSAESGLATIQETARRVCIAAGRHLEEIENLEWSDQVPQLGDPSSMAALERDLRTNPVDVLVLDPAYLAMPSTDSNNLMAQGAILRGISDLCQRLGITLILAHHCKRHTGRDTYDVPELADIAWAGFAEFARQWWLVGRREKFDIGTGDHKLWLSIGGSAGHSSLWALDVAEGVASTLTSRHWAVTLQHAEDARRSAAEEREQAAQADREERRQLSVEKDARSILLAMRSIGAPETGRVIRDRALLSGARFNVAMQSLLADGAVVNAPVVKPNRSTPFEGFQLAEVTP